MVLGGDLTEVCMCLHVCLHVYVYAFTCLREPVPIHHLYLFLSLRYITASCNNIAFHELSINYCVPDANINPKGMGSIV